MNRYLVILFLFVSSLSIAGNRMCGVGPCPNPVANCVYTLDKGMVTETFEVWGDVRVTTNPYDADVWYTGDFESTYRDLVEGCKKIVNNIE